jgi:Ca-activated chloride channel homolog
VLVIVSDGGDNASSLSFNEVVSRAQRSNALVYTAIIRDPLETEANPRRLRRLAEESGGEAFEPHDVGQVPAVLEHIARDIRNVYTLGYAPAPDKGPGLRRLRVHVSGADGSSFHVRTREAYLVQNGT